MMALTLSFGTAVAGLALGQFGLSASSASLGAAVQQQSAGAQVSYILGTTSSPGSCPSYGGIPEGTVLKLAFFDYGSSAFAPIEILVNGTIYYSTAFATVVPGSMTTYSLTLTPPGACAHASGQTVALVNAYGDEVQFGT
ncbi:MAG: hypothetical protein HY297_03780 [Thaumarchaeota archaeon]|nr:hypothetical protein [Nitrososphaerota archaeon]